MRDGPVERGAVQRVNAALLLCIYMHWVNRVRQARVKQVLELGRRSWQRVAKTVGFW